MSKQLQINQLKDNVIILRQKADKTDECLLEMSILKEDIKNKNNELSSLQDKLNENYRLVAGLSSENLKLSSEKLKADDLVNDVIKEQARLKQELQKAVHNVDAMKDSDISTKKQTLYTTKNKRNNIPNTPTAFRSYNLNVGQNNPQQYNIRSSPDTSSSFDF
jgi:small-conductance mechanosensitive channel